MASPKTILRAGYVRGPYYRKSYTRRDGVHVHSAHVGAVVVPAHRIKMRGEPGKRGKWTRRTLGHNPIRILHPGSLGYSFHDPAKVRHAQLDKDVKKYGYGAVFRKVNAVRVFSKYTSPKTAAAANADINYIRAKFGGGKKRSKKGKRSSSSRRRRRR